MKIKQKHIEEMILNIAGKDGLAAYRVLRNRQNINEFDIAAKLKLTINQIRNVIYKFEKYNLISSTRKKDRKKGWYIYFFTFNQGEAEKTVLKLKEEKIRKLKNLLELEAAHEFYACPNQCMRITIENAMENSFMCHECSSLLQPEKKDRNTGKVKYEIESLKKELKEMTG